MEANTNTGTCQICARVCKIVRGKISLHGYQRPGHGEINGRCPGAKELPYEQSCEALKAYIAGLQARRTLLTSTTIPHYENPELQEVTVVNVRRGAQGSVVTYRRGERTPTEWGTTVDNFAIVVANRIREAQDEIRSLDREIGRQTARVDGWKLAA